MASTRIEDYEELALDRLNEYKHPVMMGDLISELWETDKSIDTCLMKVAVSNLISWGKARLTRDWRVAPAALSDKFPKVDAYAEQLSVHARLCAELDASRDKLSQLYDGLSKKDHKELVARGIACPRQSRRP